MEEDALMKETDWKEKYFQLEAKMAHFHSQASEIKKKLAIKIEALTLECLNATERAVAAENELKHMKQKMTNHLAENNEQSKRRIQELENLLSESRDLLAKSETQLKYEINQREDEREGVQRKTIKIKKWIAKKLQEVEMQKKELFEANQRASNALYEMQLKVQDLSSELNLMRQSHYTVKSTDDTPPAILSYLENNYSASTSPLPSHSPLSESRNMIFENSCLKSPSLDSSELHSPLSVFERSHKYEDVQRRLWTSNNSHTSSHLIDQQIPESLSTSTPDTISPLSSVEVELHKKHIRKEDKFVLESLGRKEVSGIAEDLKMKNSLGTVSPVSDISKCTLSEMSPKETEDSKKKKKSATLPMARSSAKKISPTHHHSSLIGTFGSLTKKFRGFTDSHNQHQSSTRRVGRSHSAGKRDEKDNRNKNSGKTNPKSSGIPTPVMKREQAKPRRSGSKHGLCISSGPTTSLVSDALPEEEESMEVLEHANNSCTTLFSTSLPSNVLTSILTQKKPVNISLMRSASAKTPSVTKPPTPPVHRTPLWETRIYDLTKTHFRYQMSDCSRFGTKHDALPSICYHSPKEKTNMVYKKFSVEVPVYTKIWGRVAQIRKIPFPEASESSGDESSGRVSDDQQRKLSPDSDVSPVFPGSGSQTKAFSTAIQMRRNGSPGLARAIKRANSTQSVTSSEGDYAVPPDAVSACSDSSEPEHKLFKTGVTGAPTAASNRRNSNSNGSGSPDMINSPVATTPGLQQFSQDKCGYLTKLGGHSRTWKKRWFVLKLGKMQYFKSPSDTVRCLGEIELSEETNIWRGSSDDSQPIFQLSSVNQTIYLSADSPHAADDWIRALQVVLNRPRTLGLRKAGRYRSLAQEKVSLKGWVERSQKEGKRKRLWACIGSSSLYFYKDEEEKIFVGRLSLRDCRVFPMDLEDEDLICLKFPSCSGQQRADVILLLSTKQEKEAWLYRLTVASGSLSLPSSADGTEAIIGTPYERLVARLMYAALCNSDGGDDSIIAGSASPLWRNPILSYNRDTLSEPLTTLSSYALKTEALKLFKTCQLFMNVPLDSASVDYHVTLAQRTAFTCLTHPQLQEDVYAQLIKQSNRKMAKQNLTAISNHERNTMGKNTDDIAVHQVWKLLALLIPLFLPHQRLLWFLKVHLHRHGDDKTEMGQYVLYCRRALDRALSSGCRTSPPSRTEAISILLQNPFQHSLPFSIPVHFLDGKYQVISFDASTSVEEFTNRYVCSRVGVRSLAVSGFALFTDNPVEPNIEHFIPGSAKQLGTVIPSNFKYWVTGMSDEYMKIPYECHICDIISEWERCYRENYTGKSLDASNIVKFTFRQHIYISSNVRNEMEKEKLLLVHQNIIEIVNNRFPVTRELAIELASLCSQMTEGDYKSGDQNVLRLLEKFYPKKYLEIMTKQQIRQLKEKFCEKWNALKCSPQECARVFLSAVRKSSLYGAKLFKAKIETSSRHKGATVWIAVHENRIEERNFLTMEVEHSYKYDDVTTYGGCGDSLMLVVEKSAGSSHKLFYSMPRSKAFEMVSIMTEYIKLLLSSKMKGLGDVA